MTLVSVKAISSRIVGTLSYFLPMLFSLKLWSYTECGRKTWRFLSPVILAIVWGGVMQPKSVASWFHAISVAMAQWTAQHRAFAVEAHFKNGDSTVTTRRLFRRHFNPLAPELFFLILAHPVYKMWIIQEPNKLALWNKLHFEEKKLRV